MASINCFDVANEVIQEASARFAPGMALNEERFDIFRGYCEAFNRLVKEFDVQAFETEVDELTAAVGVSLFCEDCVVESKNHLFFKLADRSESMSFYTEDGLLVIKFMFPSLWDNVK